MNKLKLQYTETFERICTFIIDMIFLLIFSFIIYAIALIFTIPSILTATDEATIFTDINYAVIACWVAYVLVGILYFPALESSKYQGSIGKYVLKIKVVDIKGDRVTFLRAFCRFVIFAFFSKIVIWAILFTKEKKGIHDMICDTRVINRT